MYGEALLEAETVSVPNILLPTSFQIFPHQISIIAGGENEAQIAIALILSGRMRTYQGLVGFRDQALTTGQIKAILQKSTALIDVEEVSAPDPEAKFSNFLKEELEFAGKKPRNSTVHQLLHQYDAGHYLDTALAEVPKDLYLRLYLELAAQRPGVDTLVIFQPDRYDEAVEVWPELAEQYRQKGFNVIVILRLQSALAYTDQVIRLGRDNANHRELT
jgi:hypothetical protein